MNLLTIKRVVRAGLLDFSRNAFVSASSIVVMTVTLFVIGTVLFAGVILNFTLADLRSKADINVYFVVGAAEEQILSVKQSLEVRPEVASVEYVTAEEVLARFRERHKNNQSALLAIEAVERNPFGAILNVNAKDISQYDAIAQFLQNQGTVETGQPSIIDKISYFDIQHRVALDRLVEITSSAQKLGLIAIALLIAMTVAIAFNTLRLAIYTSRDEIQVQRLVGASSFFIRGPFVVEGTLYGVVAGVITLLLFYPLTWWVGSATADFFGGINLFSYYVSNFPLFFLIIMGTGMALGALASFLAVRRYLKI